MWFFMDCSLPSIILCLIIYILILNRYDLLLGNFSCWFSIFLFTNRNSEWFDWKSNPTFQKDVQVAQNYFMGVDKDFSRKHFLWEISIFFIGWILHLFWHIFCQVFLQSNKLILHRKYFHLLLLPLLWSKHEKNISLGTLEKLGQKILNVYFCQIRCYEKF